MTITQTVDIPTDRRVFFEFLAPQDIPAGKARIEVIVTPVSVNADSGSSGTAELRGKLHKLRGSLGMNAFGGLDGVAYQQKVRTEWE